MKKISFIFILAVVAFSVIVSLVFLAPLKVTIKNEGVIDNTVLNVYQDVARRIRMNRSVDEIQRILEENKKLDLGTGTPPTGNLLTTSVIYKRPDVLKYLLDIGADPKLIVDIPPNGKTTSLHLAIFYDDLEMVQIILENHPESIYAKVGDKNPLDYALKLNSDRITSLLERQEKGAGVELQE